MDKAVGEVVAALKAATIYSNTVLVFISDNGARFMRNAKGRENPNYPLKGFKNTIYEGGAKVPGFVHSPLLQQGARR